LTRIIDATSGTLGIFSEFDILGKRNWKNIDPGFLSGQRASPKQQKWQFGDFAILAIS
jgi:hypothetical protein